MGASAFHRNVRASRRHCFIERTDIVGRNYAFVRPERITSADALSVLRQKTEFRARVHEM